MTDKKQICRGIFVYAIITIVLVFGFQTLLIWVYSKCIGNITDIGALSSFYSVVFTVVAIIIGIAAIIGWHWIRDEWAKTEKEVNGKIIALTDKLNKFNEVEKKVDFLIEKKELAQWVQELFDKDSKKQIISLTELPISSTEDENNFKKIEEKIIEDATDDSWLKIIYAKKLLESANRKSERMKRLSRGECDDYKKKKVFSEIRKTYERVDNVFNFIQRRDLFNSNSDIEVILHNLQGKANWEWYKAEKLFFISGFKNGKNAKEWKRWWGDEKLQKYLENSIGYYNKSLSIAEDKGENADETLGNLALVQIELSKFSTVQTKAELNGAITLLEKKEKRDFNTYWDHARALYYLNAEENERKTRDLLNQAVSAISSRQDRDFLIERLEAELNERIDGKLGFPGDKKIINRLKKDLANKF